MKLLILVGWLNEGNAPHIHLSFSGVEMNVRLSEYLDTFRNTSDDKLNDYLLLDFYTFSNVPHL